MALNVLYILSFNHNPTERSVFIYGNSSYFIESYAVQEGQAYDSRHADASAVSVDLTLPKMHRIAFTQLPYTLHQTPTYLKWLKQKLAAGSRIGVRLYLFSTDG